jgi:hypothetical protein
MQPGMMGPATSNILPDFSRCEHQQQHQQQQQQQYQHLPAAAVTVLKRS